MALQQAEAEIRALRYEVAKLREAIKRLQEAIARARTACAQIMAQAQQTLSASSGVPRGEWAFRLGAYKAAEQILIYLEVQ